MICPTCGFDNSARDSHCRECAAALRSVEDEILTNRNASAEADPAVAPPTEKTAQPPPPVAKRSKPAPADQVPPPKRVTSRSRRSSKTVRTSRTTFTRRIEETATHRSGGATRRTIKITDENGRVGTYKSVEEMPPKVRAMYEGLTKDLSFSTPDEWLSKPTSVVESLASPKITPRRGRSAAPPHPVAGVSVQEIGGTLRLTRRWWLTKSIIVAGIMTPFLAYGASELFQASAKWGSMIICVGLIPGLISLLAAYHLLGLLFNRTVIDVNDTMISVRHGPLSISRSQQLDADELNQLYVEEKITYNKHGANYDYDLWVITDSDVHIKLLSRTPDPRQAKYLERAIESKLGMVDRPVEGAWE